MRREDVAYYTKKEKMRVVMCTHSHWIEGDMYVLPGSRLTDHVNVKAKDFFPVTDAKIYDLSADKILYSVSYVAVNRDDIAMIFPLGEVHS